MKFLETTTPDGNDVLVPIDKIGFICVSDNTISCQINIGHADGVHCWVEFFEDEEDMMNRFKEIEELLNRD